MPKEPELPEDGPDFRRKVRRVARGRLWIGFALSIGGVAGAVIVSAGDEPLGGPRGSVGLPGGHGDRLGAHGGRYRHAGAVPPGLYRIAPDLAAAVAHQERPTTRHATDRDIAAAARQ